MFSRVVFLVLLTGCLGAHERSKRSLNGTKVVHTTRLPNNTIVELPYGIDYPYMIQVQHGENHVCGGVLVKPNFAITARHCLSWNFGEANNSNYYLIAGNQIRNDRSSSFVQFRQVEKIVKHPSKFHHFDIAVIKVKKPFDLNIHVNVVKFSPQIDEKIYYNHTAVILGWGVTENKTYSDYLLKVSGTIIDCKLIWNTNICVQGTYAYPRGGDSGGPAVIEGKTPADDLVIGVLGSVATDTRKIYVVSLAYFSEWINNTIATM